MSETKIDAINAIPNPSRINASPRIFATIIKIKALMTSKKKPNVNIVIGKVRMINNGLNKKFKIDKIKLANKAVAKSRISKEANNCDTAINAIAFRKIDKNQLKNIRIVSTRSSFV